VCGIVAVLQQRPSREAPALESLLLRLDEAVARVRKADVQNVSELTAIAEELKAIDAELRGPAGTTALLSPVVVDGPAEVEARAQQIDAVLRALEASLDAGDASWPTGQLEAGNAVLVRLKDAAWAIGRDRPDTTRGIADLAGESPIDAISTMSAFWAIQVALSAIDRLEVRGRDSAGLHVLVTGHDLDLDQPEIDTLLSARESDELFTSLAVRTPEGHLSFVYKVAAEIGELGDNTRALRAAIRNDPVLHRALRSPGAQVTVLGHTRWASVGVISEANAHPLNSEELPAGDAPYVIGAVNGDVDNYRALCESEGLRVAPEITTDSKVVPTLMSRRIAAGQAVDDAFASTVARFEGSAAIAASAADSPDRLHLALHGSGQSLYVGLAEDAFVVASEPYGVVQETSRYLPMEGEGGAEASFGQVVVLDRAGAGTLEGLTRLGYDGVQRPVDESEDVRVAEITPRDIDRAAFPHFLLKEIFEAPESFRKTLRGKITGEDGEALSVRLGPEVLPPEVVERLESGGIGRVRVIAQGTAAVAGQSVAGAIAAALRRLPIPVDAILATELSGFELVDDMSDTLIVAVSQSGTTTDTNRTVDLVRSRGAQVVSIVNRRNSDLVDKSDGVLYTSDGRDVEMSVASTKAFYAQVAAGLLLSLALADHLGCRDEQRADRLLRGLRALPEAMEEVLAGREAIAKAAAALAPYRRHWAVVGNGPNRVAAEEVRIKLSELCYHSIACDGTEDKKHIDLSSEPLILVCAAGLSGPNADDSAKEVAIFRAHKAAPVVIASRGEAARFPADVPTIEVPVVEPEVAFVLSAMVGHLFGYEAALAIDSHARPLREARAAIDSAIHLHYDSGEDMLTTLRPSLETATARFFEGLRAGAYNGNLDAGTAVRVSSLLRYAAGLLTVEGYELEFGKVGTPEAIVEDLAEALTAAVEELTRPVDAIKHQAKTVTVGISRSEETLLEVPLVAHALGIGTPVEHLSYRAMRTLAALDPAVGEVEGYTRYRIEGDVSDGATAEIVDRGGVAVGLPSRTDRDNRLLGAKHRAAQVREVTVAVGARDGRTLILVPEAKGNAVTGMTLLHVRFHDTLPSLEAREVLGGYRGRYAALVDAVTETDASFNDERLAEIPLVELLTEPVHALARRWKQSPSPSTTVE
jgi:glucosamine--fructose-6-phosphate aminotransferase (isomerizing)